MSCLHVHAELNRDPTQTKTLRRQYEADMYKRFRKLKGLINKTIVDNDAFNLTRNLISFNQDIPDKYNIGRAQAIRKFEFTSDDRKVSGFMEWLRKAEDADILEVIEREGQRVVERNEWQNVYIRNAYQKGMMHAESQLKRQGVDVRGDTIRGVFTTPIHADRLGLLYTRNFRELEGVTEAMNQQISRVLADGFSEGKGPREIARLINNRVDKIGITRARMISRTEIIRSHAESTLNTYETYGIPEVVSEIEWATAGGNVCDLCLDAESNNPYKVDEARGLIPRHPNSYSKDTEIYTEEGFKLVSEVKVGEKVLSLNPKTFDLKWKNVKRTYKHKEQNMVHFHSRNFDMLVTPNHDVFCKRRERKHTKKRFWEFIKAKDVPTETQFYRSSKWQGEYKETVKIKDMKLDGNLFASFMGWYLSEGSASKKRIQISQNSIVNKDNYDNIYKLLKEIFPNKALYESKGYIEINFPELSLWLKQFGHSHEKYVPKIIKDMSSEQIRLFLNSYYKGDGHRRKNNYKNGNFRDEIEYFTSSKRMADDIGELLIKCGRRPSYKLQKNKGVPVKHKNGVYKGNYDLWRIRECYGKISRMGHNEGIQKEIISYNDMSYCVEIPEWHTLWTRRKGKTVWSGNCRCAWLPVISQSQTGGQRQVAVTQE